MNIYTAKIRIFISSAISTISALIGLAQCLFGAPGRALRKLERLEWAALLLEMGGLFAFLRTSGQAARPGEKGRAFWSAVFGAGLALPWLLQTSNLIGKKIRQTQSRARPAHLAACALFIVSYALA